MYRINRFFITTAAEFIFVFAVSIVNAQQQKELFNPKYFTLIKTYGDGESLPKEYLLAFPYSFDVDNNNNVYVFDEKKIKVYTPDGNPKAIIGGPGQGPGEFYGSAGGINIGPQGFIKANAQTSSSIGYKYNLYNPLYKFIKIFTIENKRFLSSSNKIIFINENEYVITEDSDEIKDNFIITKFSLILYKKTEKTSIAAYSIPTFVVLGHLYMEFPFPSEFCWSIAPDNSVYYSFIGKDEIQSTSGNFYIIHQYIPFTSQSKEFKFSYSPISLKENDKISNGWGAKSTLGFSEEATEKKLQALYDKLVDKLNVKYKNAVRNIVFDNYTAFVIREKINEDNSVNVEMTESRTGKIFTHKEYPEILVDIIDLKTVKLLNSLYLPKEISKSVIKNGYLYSLGTNDDGYYCIKKYRINPEAYSDKK